MKEVEQELGHFAIQTGDVRNVLPLGAHHSQTVSRRSKIRS